MWFQGLGERFSFKLFIFGSKYAARKKSVHVLLNFLSGKAKLAIWKTRENWIQGLASVHPVLMLKGLLAARIRVEFAYYRLTGNLDDFFCTWGLDGVLCSVQDEMLFFSI